MKTIRLAGMTALISSVVLLDNMDAWAGPPETPQEEELAARLQSIADDPELAADAAEYEKAEAAMAKKKADLEDADSLNAQPSPKKKPARKSLSNTKNLHRESHL
jgi:hypothetical protein